MIVECNLTAYGLSKVVSLVHQANIARTHRKFAPILHRQVQSDWHRISVVDSPTNRSY
ncbi:hypothetical protein L3V23_18175 [Vibrio sp. A1-b2]|uniref:hypothetical protein n=1 Tax=Vibrio sp. A1-b2 TaxID=2912248 RepID=UPI001F2DDA6C|nr:hypothetical protein [Vibrio sp. A1-b2]MCF7364011.1 hypothetical protein [Vibrio sp. A1-b2]